jgi:hypothetical protein
VEVRAGLIGLFVCALGTLSCATTTQATASGSPAAMATAPAAGPSTDPGTTARTAWLEMFARGYFPGRSGQIFVVPREGEVITDRDSLYKFMHGSPWEYDRHIPLLFHGAPFIRQGHWAEPATQQDIAPTLGALIGAPPSSTYTGRVLAQVVAQDAGRPRVVLLLVLDGMRADYFERYADALPTLTQLRREGAWFSQARTVTLPTVTGVGHATIGTGSDPRFHGITVNSLFSRVAGRSQPAYAGLDPGELMALTLADRWNLATDGAAVIIGHGGAIRATAGLIGRGACLVNGRKVIAASYSARDAGWETNPTCYTMSEALKALNGKSVWQQAGGTWMGHDIASPEKFRQSSLYQKFEAEALRAVIELAPVGADDIPDLVFVNMKGPDYAAHAHGPASAELKDMLAEMDRQIAAILALVDRKAGAGRSVVAITADHGMPDEPPPGHRHYPEDITAAIHERFDPTEKKVVQFYGDAANSQLFIDTARLRARGFSLNDLAAFLAKQEYYAAVFTEDEVQAAQARLPMPR